LEFPTQNFRPCPLSSVRHAPSPRPQLHSEVLQQPLWRRRHCWRRTRPHVSPLLMHRRKARAPATPRAPCLQQSLRPTGPWKRLGCPPLTSCPWTVSLHSRIACRSLLVGQLTAERVNGCDCNCLAWRHELVSPQGTSHQIYANSKGCSCARGLRQNPLAPQCCQAVSCRRDLHHRHHTCLHHA